MAFVLFIAQNEYQVACLLILFVQLDEVVVAWECLGQYDLLECLLRIDLAVGNLSQYIACVEWLVDVLGAWVHFLCKVYQEE